MTDKRAAGTQQSGDRRSDSGRRDSELRLRQARKVVRRRRAVAIGSLVLIASLIASIVVLESGGAAGGRRGGTSEDSGSPPTHSVRQTAPFAVGLRVLRLVDKSRTIQLSDGESEPRTLETEVFYPALGASGRAPVSGASPATADGPFPLLIFGHGFAETPRLYARLLEAWARAGYVVAAPVFPRENADAPGGPDESDLVNQPADMQFVISRMLALSKAASGFAARLIDPAEIAVSGQSDGGDTALAVAYDGPYRDRRVGAAIILSGAEIPALGSFTFPRKGPPLLATQGTADTINLPSATETFFAAAQPPKYLLRLIGAEHLPPYSTEQPQLGIVERVTIAFLDGYLKHSQGALARLASLGNVPGTATMLADP
jgi:dienelactone hydrolase